MAATATEAVVGRGTVAVVRVVAYLALLFVAPGCSEPGPGEPIRLEPDSGEARGLAALAQGQRPQSELGAAEAAAFAEMQRLAARRNELFDACAMDEYSFVQLRRMEAGGDAAVPPEECRLFWALARDYRLEHECLQPAKPDGCADYLALKGRLGL